MTGGWSISYEGFESLLEKRQLTGNLSNVYKYLYQGVGAKKMQPGSAR